MIWKGLKIVKVITYNTKITYNKLPVIRELENIWQRIYIFMIFRKKHVSLIPSFYPFNTYKGKRVSFRMNICELFLKN